MEGDNEVVHGCRPFVEAFGVGLTFMYFFMALMPHVGCQLEAMVPTSTTRTPPPKKKNPKKTEKCTL